MGEELDTLRTTVDDQSNYDNNSTDTQPKSKRRRKRFLSYPRYVELMVTADAKMTRYHEHDLEHYILTIMSVVSKIMFLKILFSVEDLCCIIRCFGVCLQCDIPLVRYVHTMHAHHLYMHVHTANRYLL